MDVTPIGRLLAGRVLSSNGVSWPWWIPIGIMALAVGAAGVAIAQRDPVFPPGVDELLGAVAIAMWLAPKLFWNPPRILFGAVITLAVTGLMVVEPVAMDFAPMVLTLLAGELAATTSVRHSAAFALVFAGVLVALDVATVFEGSAFWLVGIAVGWDIGFIFQWQMRLIEHERLAAGVRAEQAATQERQRIAREVHDVVAHSLSVTMLHLTAARRSLEDGDSACLRCSAQCQEPDAGSAGDGTHDGTLDGTHRCADIAEAVDALRDAERLGREAMGDIRQTVGLLQSGRTATQPLPGVPEIAELMDEFRTAGLRVSYRQHGEPSAVSRSCALGLYRVAQESLSNVAKHAPGAQVRATLDLTAETARFRLWNSLPDGVRTSGDGTGSGLRGMSERARLMGGRFRAGPDEGGWLVALDVGRCDEQCAPEAAHASASGRPTGSGSLPAPFPATEDG